MSIIDRLGQTVGASSPAVGSTDTVTRVHTVAGDATFGITDGCLVIKKTVGAATNVNIPAAVDRFGLDVLIKDGKGDANTNAITPVFSGVETCDTLTGTSLQITTPYGFLKMRPYPDGSGYFQLDSQL